MAYYGAAFVRQWENVDLVEVKAVWAEKLGGFSAEHFADALKACEAKPYPPNLPEFLEMCRIAAKRTVSPRMALEQKLTDEEIERNRKRAAEMVATLTDKMTCKP